METKKQELQNIKKMWTKLEYVLNNKCWSKYGTKYLKQNREESRSHLSFKPYGVEHGLTITQEAKFFAVQRIAEYLYNLDNKPSLKSYMHTVQSVYIAYALVDEFRTELQKVMSQEEAEHFIKLDYCKFADSNEVF